MNNLKPRPKVMASGGAGAVTTIIVFILTRLGMEIPPDVAAAITMLLSMAAGYMQKEAK